MATTGSLGTHRAPRIALAVELDYIRGGLASVADIATALDVLTAIVTEHPEPRPSALHVEGPHRRGGISALVAVELDDAPLIVSGGFHDGALRSWRLDGTP